MRGFIIEPGPAVAGRRLGAAINKRAVLALACARTCGHELRRRLRF